MSTTKAEQLMAITKTFSALQGACDWTHDWNRYLAIVRDEENQHRRGTPNGCTNGLSREKAVQLFAIKNVFDCFIPGENGKVFTPEAKDFLHVKTSIYAAHAIADTCAEPIQRQFTNEQMRQWLSTVDYVELNKA